MLCFPMICGWAGSKSNLGKAAGAEVAVVRRHEKLQREAHFQSKCASRYMFGPLLEVAMWKNCTPL